MSRNNSEKIAEMPQGLYKGFYGTEDGQPVERLFEVAETDLEIKMLIEDCGKVAIISDRLPLAYMRSLPGMDDLKPKTIEQKLKEGESNIISFKEREK